MNMDYTSSNIATDSYVFNPANLHQNKGELSFIFYQDGTNIIVK
jgi:hypothetical protein